ncbi:hypothetical protein COO60DRAFT_680289 [Scenedesmus sp. NREL 46B-D3]|nr:hypothetical protein COO60DRAFT_680289 [Scenedesmus sp. NREL 46B-D3]
MAAMLGIANAAVILANNSTKPSAAAAVKAPGAARFARDIARQQRKAALEQQRQQHMQEKEAWLKERQQLTQEVERWLTQHQQHKQEKKAWQKQLDDLQQRNGQQTDQIQHLEATAGSQAAVIAKQRVALCSLEQQLAEEKSAGASVGGELLATRQQLAKEQGRMEAMQRIQQQETVQLQRRATKIEELRQQFLKASCEKAELKSSLDFQKEATAKAEATCLEVQGELAALQAQHAQVVQQLSDCFEQLDACHLASAGCSGELQQMQESSREQHGQLTALQACNTDLSGQVQQLQGADAAAHAGIQQLQAELAVSAAGSADSRAGAAALQLQLQEVEQLGALDAANSSGGLPRGNLQQQQAMRAAAEADLAEPQQALERQCSALQGASTSRLP